MAHVYVGASLLAISDAEKSIASKLAPTAVAIACVGWVERSDTHQLGGARSDRESKQ